MKSVTITWRSDKLRGKGCLSRFKLPEPYLGLVLYVLDSLRNQHFHFVGYRPSCWRATRSGKLIVRLATYQGV